MDITFQTPEGRFNYRVAAVIAHRERLLVMRDDAVSHYSLPGGRVALYETAEQALARELREELGIDARIVRPLWLNQSFFVEDKTLERFHELCLYYLIDAARTDLPDRGDSFVFLEDGRREHWFSWMPFAQLREACFYPLFLKERIWRLPEQLEILTEYE